MQADLISSLKSLCIAKYRLSRNLTGIPAQLRAGHLHVDCKLCAGTPTLARRAATNTNFEANNCGYVRALNLLDRSGRLRAEDISPGTINWRDLMCNYPFVMHLPVARLDKPRYLFVIQVGYSGECALPATGHRSAFAHRLWPTIHRSRERISFKTQ